MFICFDDRIYCLVDFIALSVQKKESLIMIIIFYCMIDLIDHFSSTSSPSSCSDTNTYSGHFCMF